MVADPSDGAAAPGRTLPCEGLPVVRPFWADAVSAAPIALIASAAELPTLAPVGQVVQMPPQPFSPQPNSHLYSPFRPHVFSQRFTPFPQTVLTLSFVSGTIIRSALA